METDDEASRPDPFVGVGTLVLVATGLSWLVAGNPPLAAAVQASLSLTVGVALVGYGLSRPTPENPSDTRLTLLWCAAGVVAFVFVGVWFFVVGATFETSYWLAVISSLAVGASLGLLIGGYAARLRGTNRQLEERTERLETFAGIVSHDLRNPLTVARGRLDLAQTELDGSGAVEHLEAVDAAHERMERLTETLLRLASTGKGLEDPEVVDLGSLAAESWRVVESDVGTLGVDLDRRARADPERVRQLFENLFRNALEHGVGDGTDTDEESSVTVTVGPLDDGFYVADDGPGIAPQRRDAVFETGHTDGGTGLGLAIVRRVADDHGWSVSVEESVSAGARFEVRDVEPVE